MNKLTHCSEEIARFHGVTVEEYIDGFSIDNTEMAMVHPDELEEFGALIADAHANAKSYDTVYRALPPDGKVRYIREVGQPIFDNAGKFVRMIGSAQDITEQKRIEESLKESEAVFEQAARMAHLGHWVFDEKLNRLTTCSEEIGRIHGVTAEDYLAGFAIDGVEMGLVHPDDRAAFGALVADVHANAKSYDTVYRAMQPDGTIRHVREVGQPIFDESGEFVRMIGSAQDITERKEAEEELARKEAQLRAALDNMPGGMFMVDENLVIQVYNEQYKEMYDFPDETVREGVSLAEAVRARAERGDYGPGDPEELIEQRVQGYIERMTLRHEEELPNGRIIELLRTPVEGGGGVGIATDITERKRAEQELASKEAQLNAVVENVPGGVFLLDENLNYLLTNHLYREIFGIPDGLADAGKPIEGVIRHLAPRSTYGEGELDEIVEQRLAQIREEHPAPVEVTVADQLYLMTYGRMPGGERVGIVVDITERKRAEEALREQSGIVELLHKTAASSNQAEDVTEALQSCIDAICAYKSWPIGHVYMLSESVPDTLVPTSIWHLDEPDRFTNFRDVTEQTEFKIGVGIPGRVLESGRPVWIADITKATNVPRAELAVDIGVKAGFGVPVLIGSDVVAVMEFFAPDAVEADENLISVLNNIGTQVGRMVERKSAENELAEAHELITSSIDYASNIQRSALPSDEMLSEALGEHFVIWEPRDVVGGDIYWVRRVEGGHIVVVADCTGHGVPGAFLTMIATGALRQAIIEHPDGDPAMVIARMNTFIKNSLRQGIDKGPADDGLELGICCIDADGERLTFAGARFSLWKLNSQGTEEIKGDKSGIGYRHVPPDQAFTNHEVTLAPGSTYYMFSDGLVDQVGGDKRRAFGKKRIIALLEDHLTRPLTEQRDAIMDAFATYQGDEIRRDDVTFLGFRMQS